ncbi:MAG TPA: S26 family signal peptidase [Allosphingosinicella sp.]|jgi:conjugative transfer signal peptidase TraF
MPEARNLPLRRWGEEMRRSRRVRREQRWRSAATAIAALTVSALVVTIFWRPRPLLVWNASASMPVGLYAVAPPIEVRAGEMVIARIPEQARSLAADRGYLPLNVALVKRVGAARGDRVCAVGEAIWVNGRHVAARREADGRGRRMPWWTDCRDLGDGEYLLLTENALSFDGRYFGITRKEDLLGRAVLLWAR